MLEIRQQADGSYRLEGRIMAYGDVGNPYGMPERFEPGAIEFAEAVMLTLQHDRRRALARFPGGGLQLLDSPTEARLRADMAPTTLARDAYLQVGGGVLTGLSVEFLALAERSEGGQRIIERALVPFVSLVDSPEYKLSTVEARAAGDGAAAAAPRRRPFFL